MLLLKIIENKVYYLDYQIFWQGGGAAGQGIYLIEEACDHTLKYGIYFYFKEYIHLFNSRGSNIQRNLKF